MGRKDRRTLEVGGEIFDLRDNGQGGTDYDWISGPNKGYGFSSFPSPPAAVSTDHHIAAIRDFLSMIDTETGYIAED